MFARTDAGRLWHWAVLSEGSTRPAALLRMGLALIVWARFGHDIGIYHDPGWARLAFAVLFAPAVTFMFLGLWTRLSTLLTAALVTVLFVYLSMVLHSPGVHHVYLLTVALWLSALTPAGRSLSIDRWLALRRHRGAVPPPERGPLWGQRLIALQVSVLYFWAAFDKSEPGYFSGERMEVFFAYLYGGAYDLDGSAWFGALCRAFAWGTVCTEYALAFGLFFRRLQFPLMVAGALFHGTIYLTMSVFTYSATILLLYLAFLDPETVHSGIDALLGHRPTPPAAPDPVP